MPKDVQLHNFSGPLDVLLQLIETQELPITEVALADVAEQFLAYLQEIEERHPEELADFLVVATRLLLLKSQALLPYLHPDEEEEDPNELAAQLRMYKRYAQATAQIQALIDAQRFLYPKRHVQRMPEIAFAPPSGIGAPQLRFLFVDVLARLEPIVKISKAAIAKVLSLREKIGQLQQMFSAHTSLRFDELLADAEDREEVVVTFLAVLELVKQQTVAVKQEGAFANIHIQKV